LRPSEIEALRFLWRSFVHGKEKIALERAQTRREDVGGSALAGCRRKRAIAVKRALITGFLLAFMLAV